MSVNNKRVFYVKYLPNEIYAEILRARPDVRLDRLENESTEDISAPILAAAHAYQVGAARDELAKQFHVDADLLRRAPNLLIVSSNGAGYDPVDVEACTAAGVLAVNQSGGNAHSVAEHALGMLLTLSKRILEADRALRREANVSRNALMGTEAQGKTIGIVGLGNVGRRIAALCEGLLGMKVLAYDPYLEATEMAARGGEKVELDELLRRSDYVSISCPLTRQSRGMIGAREFALMQPHAYFITTARGFIHDEAALLEALRNKRIAGAGLDVWAKEPPPPDHPLLEFDNGKPAHGRRDQGSAGEHGQDCRRAVARRARRQAAAADHQPRGLARLRQAFPAGFWIHAGIAVRAGNQSGVRRSSAEKIRPLPGSLRQ